MSIIYFLIVLLVSWIFYTLMMRKRGAVMTEHRPMSDNDRIG